MQDVGQQEKDVQVDGLFQLFQDTIPDGVTRYCVRFQVNYQTTITSYDGVHGL